MGWLGLEILGWVGFWKSYPWPILWDRLLWRMSAIYCLGCCCSLYDEVIFQKCFVVVLKVKKTRLNAGGVDFGVGESW